MSPPPPPPPVSLKHVADPAPPRQVSSIARHAELASACVQELHAGKAPEAQAAAAKAQIVAKYAGLPLTVVTDEAGTSASLQLGGGTSIGGGRDGNAIAKCAAETVP